MKSESFRSKKIEKNFKKSICHLKFLFKKNSTCENFIDFESFSPQL